MAQTQTLVIKHVGKHLKLDSDQLQISKKQGPMLLKVEVHKGGASQVILWFPDQPPVFPGPNEIPIPLSLVGGVWKGETNLEVNSKHPEGVAPYAIYCDIDGTGNPAEFEQKGRQMVDGKHSHPDCNVGP